ncbi:MAG TPA: PIN domain-containing protein [Terrimicrobiaceae bacterium]
MLALVDTGPLVAYLDRSDPAHEFVRARWDPIAGRFVTTAAVFTEAMHFLGSVQNGPQALVNFFREGALLLEDVFQLPLLERATTLMARYPEVSMDFADATLIVLAGNRNTPNILTLDERGFRTFRYRRNKPFRLLLQEDS